MFLRGREFNISLVFVSQSYFKVPKTIRLNATHYLIIKIPNKRELQQIASNRSSDTDFKDFMKLYKDYTKESYSFLVKMQLCYQEELITMSIRRKLIQSTKSSTKKKTQHFTCFYNTILFQSA